VALLRRFGEQLRADVAPNTREDLLKQFVRSDVSAAGYPTALFSWPTDTAAVAGFQTADIPIPVDAIRRMVAEAHATKATIYEAIPTIAAVELVMVAPSTSGGVTAVVVAPKSRLFDIDPYARLLGLDVDTDAEPPYTLRLRERLSTEPVDAPVTWRREVNELHGDGAARTGMGVASAHVEVELRRPYDLVQRGALIVLLDLAIVGLLWLASVVADGGAGRWFRARRRTWGRSYRARLSFALFGFFVIPALAFALWSYQQLATDARRSRELLVGETLRALTPPPGAPLCWPAECNRLDTPLMLYRLG
jgi:hypothetical protein